MRKILMSNRGEFNDIQEKKSSRSFAMQLLASFYERQDTNEYEKNARILRNLSKQEASDNTKETSD